MHTRLGLPDEYHFVTGRTLIISRSRFAYSFGHAQRVNCATEIPPGIFVTYPYFQLSTVSSSSHIGQSSDLFVDACRGSYCIYCIYDTTVAHDPDRFCCLLLTFLASLVSNTSKPCSLAFPPSFIIQGLNLPLIGGPTHYCLPRCPCLRGISPLQPRLPLYRILHSFLMFMTSNRLLDLSYMSLMFPP